MPVDVGKALKVVALDDFRLLITFTTGERKIYDVKPLLKYPAYAPIRNPAFFNTAYITRHTVAWNNDIDLCPERIYEDSVSV